MNETLPDVGCVAWALFLTVIFALFQITNAFTVLQHPEAITAFVSSPVWLNSTLSLLWAGLFGFAALRLVRMRQNAIGYTVRLFMLFAAYSLLRLILFTQADYDRNRLPFLIIIVLMLLIAYAGMQWHHIRKHTNTER
ncbi:MAG: hypothetical protein ACPG7F_07180 [Aggregatilineales bacterium]